MAVNESLTPKRTRKRRRRGTETVDYLAMLGRLIDRAGLRVGTADMDELTMLLDCRSRLDDAIAVAVGSVRENGGYSWAAIGEAAGMTRQAAYQRWGRS
jgi:hypothetical protein